MNTTLRSPARRASTRPFSSIAATVSTATTARTRGANARATWPVPAATSSTRSSAVELEAVEQPLRVGREQPVELGVLERRRLMGEGFLHRLRMRVRHARQPSCIHCAPPVRTASAVQRPTRSGAPGVEAGEAVRRGELAPHPGRRAGPQARRQAHQRGRASALRVTSTVVSIRPRALEPVDVVVGDPAVGIADGEREHPGRRQRDDRAREPACAAGRAGRRARARTGRRARGSRRPPPGAAA